MDYENYENGKYAVYILKIGENAYYIGKSKEVRTRLYKHRYEILNGKKNYYWKKHFESVEDCKIMAVFYFDTKYEMDRFENIKISAALKASKEKSFTVLNYQTSNKLSEQSDDVKNFINNFYNKKNMQAVNA